MAPLRKNNVNYSKFDLGHTHKTTMDMGKLVPIACIPTLPNDKFKIDVSAFVRGMPTLAPIMDKVDIKVNHFYVPYRVLWKRFEEFITHSDHYKLRGTPAPTMPVIDRYSVAAKMRMDSYKAKQEINKYRRSLESSNVSGAGSWRDSDYPEFNDVFEKFPLGRLMNYLGVNIPGSDAHLIDEPELKIMSSPSGRNYRRSGADSVNRSGNLDRTNWGNPDPNFKIRENYKDFISLMLVLAYNKIYLDYYTPQRWVEYFQTNNTAHPLMKLKKYMNEIYESNNFSLTSENFKDAYKVSDKKYYKVLENADFDRKIESFDIKVFEKNEENLAVELLSVKDVFWNHDYFTNALPEPTLFGDVKIPLFNEDIPDNQKHFKVSGHNVGAGMSAVEFADSGQFASAEMIAHNNRVSATIRDLRKATSLQHYFETLVQGGGRYLETMEVMFGNRLPDDMLQRSEYLGGSVIPLFVNEVEQSSPYEDKNGQKSNVGDLSGKPLGAGDFDNVYMEADEYGIYMCLAHIVPKRTYANIVERYWKELDAMDFPNPQFEGIGDQAVYGYEVGLSGDQNEKVFGYVPRYSHYKTKLDVYSGEMQYDFKHWHLGTEINHHEVSPEFLRCNPREDIFIVPTENDKFMSTFKIDVDAVRPLSQEAPVGIYRI